MPTGTPDLIDRVGAALERGPALHLAVVFGSTARGTRRPDSDVDVGFVPVDPELPLRVELALQADIERACGRPVHLVRLDRASTVLKWRVAREGRPVLIGAPGAWSRFVARSGLEYADMEPLLRYAERRFRERIAQAGVS